MIKAVFFDFGGVMAEEGWERGLADIAACHSVDSKQFFDDACDVLWSTGYMYGRATEDQFWFELGKRYSFKLTVEEMRGMIFDRFQIRQPVIDLIKKIGADGRYRLAILSDQTNWLDQFNEQFGFFGLFEKVYNSYHLGLGKKQVEVFPMVCDDFGVRASEVLFVDDNAGHIERALSVGLQVYHFADWQGDVQEIEKLLDI